MPKDESHAQQDQTETLVLVLPALACHRVQLNAKSKVRVTDVSKRINLYAVMNSKLSNQTKKGLPVLSMDTLFVPQFCLHKQAEACSKQGETTRKDDKQGVLTSRTGRFL